MGTVVEQVINAGSKPFKLMKKKAKPKPKVSYKLDIKSSDCHITAELSVMHSVFSPTLVLGSYETFWFRMFTLCVGAYAGGIL